MNPGSKPSATRRCISGTAGTFCRRSGRWTRLLPIRLMGLGFCQQPTMPWRANGMSARTWDTGRNWRYLRLLSLAGVSSETLAGYFDRGCGDGGRSGAKTGTRHLWRTSEVAWTGHGHPMPQISGQSAGFETI